MIAPELLDVRAVLARYGLRDRRAARKVIDEAGGFVLAGRLLVRLDDLVAHEDALREERRQGSGSPDSAAPVRAPRVRRRAARAPREPLRPGWWREDSSAGDAA